MSGTIAIQRPKRIVIHGEFGIDRRISLRQPPASLKKILQSDRLFSFVQEIVRLVVTAEHADYVLVACRHEQRDTLFVLVLIVRQIDVELDEIRRRPLWIGAAVLYLLDRSRESVKRAQIQGLDMLGVVAVSVFGRFAGRRIRLFVHRAYLHCGGFCADGSAERISISGAGLGSQAPGPPQSLIG